MHNNIVNRMASMGMRPLASNHISTANASSAALSEDDMTVEQFLQSQCEAIIRDFQRKTDVMIKKLQKQYDGKINKTI